VLFIYKSFHPATISAENSLSGFSSVGRNAKFAACSGDVNIGLYREMYQMFCSSEKATVNNFLCQSIIDVTSEVTIYSSISGP